MKRVLVLLLGLVIGVSLCSCDLSKEYTKSSSADGGVSANSATDGVGSTENISPQYIEFMKDGDITLEPKETGSDAATVEVREGCTIRDPKGQILYVSMNQTVNPPRPDKIYGNMDLYEIDTKHFYVSGELLEGGLFDADDGYAAVISFPLNEGFTVTFDGEAEKFECEFADASQERVSYCGTGLREIEITPEKVVLRGDVVTETDEDQSELDPAERMHLKADGREIVIEPYEE